LVVAERSVPRWDAAKSNAQASRLGEVARQAAMQARRAWLPSVLPPLRTKALELPSPSLVLDETAEARLNDSLPPEAPVAVGIVIGPEGGFTADELTAFRERGANPVSLGPLILRTETAALAAAAVVLGRYGLLG
jgi:16S rRNA (uracil1498-N3)-methyltransferase